MFKGFILILTLATFISGQNGAQAAWRLSSEFRFGDDYDLWIERGDSYIFQSPVFHRGIRLASWDRLTEENPEYGLASAIYLFRIPERAEGIEIEVHYLNRSEEAFEMEVAGLLFVKNTAMEELYGEELEEEELIFLGDSFLLHADRTIEVFNLPAEDHVEDGLMELHLVANSGQYYDIRYLKVSAYASPPTITYVPEVRFIHTYWPLRFSYFYYYLGPWFWRTAGCTYTTYNYIEENHWQSWESYQLNFIKNYQITPRPINKVYIEKIHPKMEKVSIDPVVDKYKVKWQKKHPINEDRGRKLGKDKVMPSRKPKVLPPRGRPLLPISKPDRVKNDKKVSPKPLFPLPKRPSIELPEPKPRIRPVPGPVSPRPKINPEPGKPRSPIVKPKIQLSEPKPRIRPVPGPVPLPQINPGPGKPRSPIVKPEKKIHPMPGPSPKTPKVNPPTPDKGKGAPKGNPNPGKNKGKGKGK